ncbi:hypothetical protein H0A66_03610 [Alcaligenaceae bacterium]|nr:hypothetical protein [Alcaligenaceae bacterium]
MAFQIVIDEYGVYVTRSGRLAFIEKAKHGPRGMLYLGYVLATAKGVSRSEWHTWTPDGRSNSSAEDRDIVEKV